MERYLFFSVFSSESEGGYTIEFPDLPGCITEGDNLEDGMKNAKEALELHLYGIDEDGDDIPEATAAEIIELKKGQFTVPVIVHLDKVRDEMENKAVSKTVTIPRWLKKEGEKQKLNFSAILQDGLKRELGIKESRHR